MTPKQFRRFIERDKHCPHCGATSEMLVPHHRSNRGMGGARSANQPANILSVCAWLNGAMESSAAVAEQAREYGWKIGRNQDPTSTPVYDQVVGEWYLLDNNYHRVVLPDK